jgi:hypothetical protein
MAPKQSEAPALFSLLTFLGINYLIGYGIGWGLTRSTGGAVALALVTPCLTLAAFAALGARPEIEDEVPDEA